MIYVASKTKHAAMWRAFRDQGYKISSTWIDEAEPGQTKDRAELAGRCIREVFNADALVLYCEPDEILKGALIELGVAFNGESNVFGIFMVGARDNVSLSSSVFLEHPIVFHCATVEEAIEEAAQC